MAYKRLPYGHSLALFTDLYELTMGQVFWAEGMAEWESVFHHFDRTNPLGGGYTVACGLELIVDYLANLKFDEEDIAYLASIPGNDNKPLFKPDYLRYLRQIRFNCDLDAVGEGTVIFPHEPLVRVKGPLLVAQLVETALLTLGNYSTAIATEAARICWAAGGAPVYDFSARRAPGFDGSFTATRSAYIGGFAGTSNVWAARHLGIPARNLKGTMAHSLVMSFDSELESFRAYARSLPNNCVFLVDTYGTIEGVKHAIQVGEDLRRGGLEMAGVRLDSGDFAKLSKQTRRLLDDAGFTKAAIMASNDLNEFLIQSLRTQDAAIGIWGVGTRLMVPSLAGVYKLAAIRKPGGDWVPKIKLSDQRIKTSIQGILQTRRFRSPRHPRARNIADCIYDERTGLAEDSTMISLADQTKERRLPSGAEPYDLLVPVMRQGKLVCELPNLEEIRAHREVELEHVADGIRRFDNPDEFFVGLEKSLFIEREEMIRELRGVSEWEQEVN